MFQASRKQTLLRSAWTLLELTFHNSVRSVRSGHRDAVFALLSSILQNIVMVAAFYFFLQWVGMRQSAIRGDFLLYVMSGVFVFMVHVKAIGAVGGAEGPTSPMMQHMRSTASAIWLNIPARHSSSSAGAVQGTARRKST